MTRAFTERQAGEIRRVLRRAEAETGLHFSVCVGTAEGDPRRQALRLHAALGAEASRAVLVFVDPNARALEIVTGAEARLRLDDQTCALAAMSMTSSFSAGDLVGGIIHGIGMLADHARRNLLIHEHGEG